MNPKEYIESGSLEAHVLGLASPEEMAEVERMRSEHPEVETEYQAVLVSVETWVQGYAKPAPESTWEAIASRIKSENGSERMMESKSPAQNPLEETAFTSPSAADNADANERVGTSGGGGRIIDINAPDKTNNYRFWQSIAAGLALLAAGSLAANMWQYGRQNTLKQELADAQQQSAVIASTARLETTRRQETEAMLLHAADPEMLHVVMNGLKDAPAAKVMVMWKKDAKSVMMEMQNMPAIPSDKDLQLWAIVDGKPVDLGVVPSRQGEVLQHPIPAVPGATAFAITLEDKGGHPEPHGVMLTLGEVKS